MSPWHCEGCGCEVIGKIRRGRCEKCYRKHLQELRQLGEDGNAGRRTYQPSKPRRPQQARRTSSLIERAFRQATPGWGGCILYTGRIDAEGYARIKDGRRQKRAHRAVYLQFVGPVPDGMMLDHLCHSSDIECPGGSTCLHRRCINPFHLEPVTPAENNMRGRSLTAQNRLKTHCAQGHPFTPENTRLMKRLRADGTPQRHCRACARIATREWGRRARKRR